jgi:ADP-heptose:LPS heptosyltransferase
LLAGAVARPLKELGYKVECITQTPNDVVYHNSPFIDKISVYEPGDWPQDPAAWQKWFAMRSKEFGRFANLSHSCEVLHAAFTNMTSFYWGDVFRRKHFGGNYLESVFDIMDLPHTFGPLFFPTAEEKEQARITKKILGRGPIIGWCITGSRIDKIYPHSPAAVGRLIKELDAQVVIFGAPPPAHDWQIAKDIIEAVKSQNGSAKGLHHAGSPSMENQTWPIRRILTFAAACDLVIGPDTGPMWGVAFEPVPKITLMSHASPRNITEHWLNTVTLHADQRRVSCWPCHKLHDTIETCRPNHLNNGAACISDISVEEIVAHARRALEGFERGPALPARPKGFRIAEV